MRLKGEGKKGCLMTRCPFFFCRYVNVNGAAYGFGRVWRLVLVILWIHRTLIHTFRLGWEGL
jgi:hypothetical protein